MAVMQNTVERSHARKPARRLKPEVAARIVAQRSEMRIQQLYDRPVDELSPDELALMRAAFFRG